MHMATANKPMPYPSFQNISTPLREFTPKLRKALEQAEKRRQYACCDVILKDWTVPDGIHILHKGEVTLSVDLGAKKGKSKRTVNAGEILGLASVLSGLPYMATAECKTACVTGHIPAKQLMEILRKNTDLCMELSGKLSADVICANLKVKSMKQVR